MATNIHSLFTPTFPLPLVHANHTLHPFSLLLHSPPDTQSTSIQFACDSFFISILHFFFPPICLHSSIAPSLSPSSLTPHSPTFIHPFINSLILPAFLTWLCRNAQNLNFYSFVPPPIHTAPRHPHSLHPHSLHISAKCNAKCTCLCICQCIADISIPTNTKFTAIVSL